MEGVILFVDDKVHKCFVEAGELKRTPENELFESLKTSYPVLGVKDLDLAERAIKAIGSFSAIILDWVFDDRDLLSLGEDSEDLKFVQAGAVKEDRTLGFLKENDFYSLVYIYSAEDIEEKYGAVLRERFGERIRFQKKPLEHGAEEIIKKIDEWKKQNQNLSIPLAWTATINQSIQQIFKELAEADPNWLHDIAQSAKEDGMSEDLFIMDLFQFLLSENNTQDVNLRKSITDYLNSQEAANAPPSSEQSIARLFNRLFYTKLSSEAPIMTGDICEISENHCGIIISPECDISRILKKEENSFELLVFEKKGFNQHIGKKKAMLDDGTFQHFTRARYDSWQNGNESQKEMLRELRKLFNQNETRFHVLPSFPLFDSLNQSVVIEFSLGRELHSSQKVKEYKREYKLNSPFIQQLRQRYLSHLGRIGVPSLPPSLRDFNLK